MSAGRALGFATCLTLAALALGAASPARAGTDVASWLLFDARTGEVLARENAFQPWYPASVTKLMTTYAVLKAMRAGRLKPSSPVTMTELANSQPPSKMGMPTGTIVTMDNALKIIMVKSANDVAWAIGEAVSGSREAFVAEMNAHAMRLGMASTNFVNSNGLPAEGQVTNAHDLGLLARALIAEFPERGDLFSIGALQLGKRKIPNHNDLLGRYPGADGMKTGFICASGFNVVASATRNGRRLVAVVLGAHSSRVRGEKAGELFTKGFEGTNQLGWFARSESIAAMTVGDEIRNPPGDLRDVVCKRHGKDDEGEPVQSEAPPPGQTWLSPRIALGQPVKIWIGGADKAPADAAPAVAVAAPLPPVKATVAPPVAVKKAPGSLFPQARTASPAAVAPAVAPEADATQPLKQSFEMFNPPAAQAQPAAAPKPVPVAVVAPPVKPGAPRAVKVSDADARKKKKKLTQ